MRQDIWMVILVLALVFLLTLFGVGWSVIGYCSYDQPGDHIVGFTAMAFFIGSFLAAMICAVRKDGRRKES